MKTRHRRRRLEPHPGVVVVAAILGTVDLLDPTDHDDVGGVDQERPGLLRRRPIEFEQQPGRPQPAKTFDHGVHGLPLVGRVGEQERGVTEILLGQLERVAGRDEIVARLDVDRPGADHAVPPQV